MARRVFFSFHFQRDAWRVGQVRNCWMIKPEHMVTPFLDAAAWETVKRQGDTAIQRWIDDQLAKTSVTVVLIGAETAGRPWVKYEIEKSWNRGNGLLGIRIHKLKTHNQSHPDPMGANPFDQFTTNGRSLSSFVNVYDWIDDNGRTNISSWIEAAAQARGR